MVLSSWQSHCERSPGSFDECRMAQSGCRPKTKPDDLGCESTCTGYQNLHPPSPFIIITQPESWYSFYRPTEGRRLSRPSWLVTYRDGLPVHRRSSILVLTRSDVAQLRWSRPTRSTKPNRQPWELSYICTKITPYFHCCKLHPLCIGIEIAPSPAIKASTEYTVHTSIYSDQVMNEEMNEWMNELIN